MREASPLVLEAPLFVAREDVFVLEGREHFRKAYGVVVGESFGGRGGTMVLIKKRHPLTFEW